ncbi:hypothetical protein BLOT_005385 [Blomia tropicalis]|nr:hypothetical protein BLOT_005385 [Blomia tropicalis]
MFAEERLKFHCENERNIKINIKWVHSGTIFIRKNRNCEKCKSKMRWLSVELDSIIGRCLDNFAQQSHI